MNTSEWEWRISDDWAFGGTALLAHRWMPDGSGQQLKVKLEVVTTVAEGEMIKEVSLVVDRRVEASDRMLHNLAAALVKAGFAAPAGEDVAGELGATKRHLTDMRALVFGQIGRDLP